MSIQEISPNGLLTLINNKEKLELIDVRTEAEFQSAHIENSRNITLGSNLFNEFKTTQKDDSQKYVLICQGGARAKSASQELSNSGIKNMYLLTGGMNGCKNFDFPFVKVAGVVSMERQVRIAAGGFVLVGSLLGLLVSSSFFIIPIFVGAGLFYSGASDTCGMAVVLGKMPWNNLAKGGSCCSNGQR